MLVCHMKYRSVVDLKEWNQNAFIDIVSRPFVLHEVGYLLSIPSTTYSHLILTRSDPCA